MSVRLNSLRVALGAMALAGGVTVAVAAHAQLGTENNPPPQHLFNFNGAPKPADNGLGTMAERRRALANAKLHRRRVVHHTPN